MPTLFCFSQGHTFFTLDRDPIAQVEHRSLSYQSERDLPGILVFSPATMESLLSHSFDYLSSFDGGKIRKGLRQLEGLLAQICLSQSGSSPSTAAEKRRSMAIGNEKESTPKELAQLKDDPAFREFFKLQEGFEWNGKDLIALLQKNPTHVV